MDKNPLAKLYDRLTPRERLPLLIAAAARGDDTEAQRLADAAPRACYGLPDYHGLSDGLHTVLLYQVAELLHWSVLYWRAMGLVDALPPRGREEDVASRAYELGRWCAYQFVVNLDGWGRFCGELGIDPAILPKLIPAYATVAMTERSARDAAFSADEAGEYLRRASSVPGVVAVTVVTAEDVAAELRQMLDGRVAWWGGDATPA
jgi:hypothetical protein